MDTYTRAPGYDLFKLVVAIILLLLFICLLLWGPANAPQPLPPTFTRTPISATATRLVATMVAPPSSSPTRTPMSDTATITAPPLASATQTSVSSTLTSTALPISTPTETSASESTATLVVISTPTNTPTPTSTEAPVPEPIPTPIVEIPAEEGVCDAIAPARLEVGMNATILRRLNFRSSPGIQNNWILTNRPGTQVEVIDGPICTRYQGGGAYRWWNIKLPDGRLGWSAEASAFGGFYFIEPAK